MRDESTRDESVFDLITSFFDICEGSDPVLFPSKAREVGRLNESLRSILPKDDIGDEDNKDVTINYERRRQWHEILVLIPPGGTEDDLFETDVQVRDEFIRVMISCCSQYDEYTGSSEEDPAMHGRDWETPRIAAFELRQRCFQCLALILRIRMGATVSATSMQDSSSSVVGSHLNVLAPCILSAIKSMSAECREAAKTVVKLLVPPLCPRDECNPAMVRDYILLPASASPSTSSVTIAAEILRWSIIATTKNVLSRPPKGSMSPHDLDDYNAMQQIKAETAAVNRVQDMKETLDNIMKHATSVEDRSSIQVILDAVRDIHGVAPHAIESRITEKGRSLLQLPEHTEEPSDISSPGGESDSSIDKNPPSSFYANLSGRPMFVRTEGDLYSIIDKVSADLSHTDPEMWNTRFDALKELECVLAGGIIGNSVELRDTFLALVKNLPIKAQLIDLRSQITRQACRFVTALAFEVRNSEDAESSHTMAMLVEMWTPSVLKLAISGVRLMATQGMNCLLHLASFGGKHGYPRIIPLLCAACTDKKSHQNYKRACILALSAAVRVWGMKSIERYDDRIYESLNAALSDRNVAVREEARKVFWALASRDELISLADSIMDGCDSREVKRLETVRDEVDGEWEEGGRMEVLVRTGVDTGGSNSPSASSRCSLGSKRNGRVSSNSSAVGSRKSNRIPRGAPPSSKSRIPREIRQSSTSSQASRGRSAVPAPSKAGRSVSRDRSSVRGERRPSMGASRSSSRTRQSNLPPVQQRRPSTGRAQSVDRSISSRHQPSSPRSRASSRGRSSHSSQRGSSQPPKPRASSIERSNLSRANSFKVASPLPRSPSTGGRQRSSSIPRATSSPRQSSSGSVCSKSSRKSMSSKKSMSSRRSQSPSPRGIPPSPSPGRLTTTRSASPMRIPASPSRARSPSPRRVEPVSFDEWVGNVNNVNANLREVGFIKLAASLQDDSHRKSIEAFTSGMAFTSKFVAGMVSNINHTNLVVAKSALVACQLCFEHEIMNKALSKVKASLLPVILDALVRFEKQRKIMVQKAAQDCIDSFADATKDADVLRVASSVLTVHASWKKKGRRNTEEKYHLLTDEGIVSLMKFVTSGIFIGERTKGDDPVPVADEVVEAFARRLLEVMIDSSSPTNSEQPQSQARCCSMLQIISGIFPCMDGYFLAMCSRLKIEELRTVVECVGSYGGEWGNKMETELSPGLPTPPKEEKAVFPTLSKLDDSKAPNLMVKVDMTALERKFAEMEALRSPRNNVSSTVLSPNASEMKPWGSPRREGAQLTPTFARDTINESPNGGRGVNSQVKTPTAGGVEVMLRPSKIPSPSLGGNARGNSPAPESTQRKIETPVRDAQSPPARQTDPIVRYMGQSTPISKEIVYDDLFPSLIAQLMKKSQPQEQYLALQGLVHHAKDHGDDKNWGVHFSKILACLLDGIRQDQSIEDNSNENDPAQPSSEKDGAPTLRASRHLFLQTIRALLRFIPSHFQNHIDTVIGQLLECSKSSTYEIVHTAERSLECLVKCLDPGRCLYSLLPFLCGDLEADENGTPSVILVSLRTLAFLVERVPKSLLQDVKPSLFPSLRQSLHNRSVDMRKAAVFVLVEMHFALGDGFLNSQELALTPAQQKLISIYIQRHKKTQEADPAFAFASQNSSPPLVSR